MDDPAPIPPLRPVAAKPADRDSRRDQRPRSRDGGATSASHDAAPREAAVAVAGTSIDDPLILALDRLRTTDGQRTADIALLRMWRGLKAYQDQAGVPSVDGAPPAP